MQILLIRHGESEDDFVEKADNEEFHLTKKGMDQVQRMSDYVRCNYPPEMIWSSTLMRARQSAHILCETVDCTVQFTDELRERNEKEDSRDFRHRADRILFEIVSKSSSLQRIAIVSHGGMITQIIDSFLEYPSNLKIWFQTDNTGIHLLDYYEAVKLIRFMNRTAHLD